MGLSPAGADPVDTAVASAYGANLDVLGTAVVNQGGLATATVPPGQDAGPNTFLLVPVQPVVISGTASGEANAHVNSDLGSVLEQETQAVAGPYNARGVGLVEGLDVLVNIAPAPLPPIPIGLVSASAVRGEAGGVCSGGTAVYSAQSEVVDLNVGGTDVGLNDPLTEVIDAVSLLLAQVASVVDITRNEVIVTGDGAIVNALHVTALGLLGEPLLDLVVGHAEVGGLTCAATAAECSDTQDNDGDGVIDAQDPCCITDGVYNPDDDDERNECVDGIDNADPEDTLVDFGSDPGCDSAEDDDETDRRGTLARTGGDQSSTAPLALGPVALAVGALTLRRRSLA
ncbi:hypothetical protein BH18ACT4_BH18ACT4_09240 [soil metagenome]